MDESPFLEPHEREMPRWVQVPVGIVLALFTLLCGAASLSLLLVKNPYSPILAILVGCILLLGCLWVLGKCFRLVTGRRIEGGLLGPTALRVVAISLLVFPVAGLFTGYYRENGPLAIFQAVMYVSGFFGFRAWARKREQTPPEETEEKTPNENSL